MVFQLEKLKRLVPNLFDKVRYVLHYKHLHLYLNYGYGLGKDSQSVKV